MIERSCLAPDEIGSGSEKLLRQVRAAPGTREDSTCRSGAMQVGPDRGTRTPPAPPPAPPVGGRRAGAREPQSPMLAMTCLTRV